MAYLGVPQSKLENLTTNVQIVNLSANFDGTTTTFNLQDFRGDPVYAVHERALLVTLGGITQRPGVDYTTSGTTITFTTAPVSNLTIQIRKLYGVQRIIGVNDGVISPVKLSTGGPVWNSSGNVTISGDLNVTGAFNAGGNGLFWEDNEKANFGSDNDLQIYHSGVNSFIRDTGTGSLFIEGTDLTLRAADSTTRYLVANETNGDVSLYYGNNIKLATKTDGVNITGELECDSLDVDGAAHFAGGDIDIVGANYNAIWQYTDNRLRFNDNAKATFGTGNDLQIYHNGSHSYISESSGTGDLRLVSSRTLIRDENDANHCIIANSGGSVDLYHNGNIKLNTISAGVQVTGSLGIGVSPTNVLDVEGTTHSKILIGTTGTGHATGLQITHAKGNAAEQMWQLQTDGSSDGNLKVRNATSNVDVMFFDADNDNIGINQTSPSSKLHITTASGSDTPGSSDSHIKFNVADDGGPGWVQRVYDSGAGSGGQDGSFAIDRQYSGSWSNTITIKRDTGNVGVGTTSPSYKLEVNGSFAATTKSFLIPHPTKENYKLRHGSLEGPENGVYVRGRTTDSVIELPDYWTGLVDEDSITVTITPIGNRHIWVEEINNNKVYINSEDTINCFYTVFAERKDVESLVVEIKEN